MTESDKAGGVAKIDEDRMKSDEGKKKWREFIQKYENKGRLDAAIDVAEYTADFSLLSRHTQCRTTILEP